MWLREVGGPRGPLIENVIADEALLVALGALMVCKLVLRDGYSAAWLMLPLGVYAGMCLPADVVAAAFAVWSSRRP